MSEYTKPLPSLNKRNRPYFEGGLQGELRLQSCHSCGHRWFPPSSHCPKCLSTDHAWEAVSGRGKVWSWIVMHQRYFKSFEADIPYTVAFIQLEEGPFLMSTLVDVERDAIHCDMPVEVVFERATEEIAIPKFRPVQA